MIRSTPETFGGIALLAMALFGLLTVSERVGLPLAWIKILLCFLVLLIFLLVVALGRTTRELKFFGSGAQTAPFLGGLTAAIVLTLALDKLTPKGDGESWLAVLLGTVAGLLAAQIGARLVRNRERQSGSGDGRSKHLAGLMSPLRGLAMVMVGAALLFSALPVATDETARLFGLSVNPSILLVLLVVLMPTLTGGGQAAAIVAMGLAATAAATLALLLLAAGLSLGPLPLPGQSEPGTLEAITNARLIWGIEHPLYFKVWPSLAKALFGKNLHLCAFAAIVSAGVMLALSSTLPVARRTTAVVAGVAATALPLALVALGGYAIETAAIKFVGTPIVKPPQALIQASQLGVVSACGAQAASAEAIRTACGVLPRDTAVFSWEQIRLTTAYVESGFAVALGYSSTFSLVTSASKLLMSLSAAILGLWLAAKGLGRDILARNNTAAGLASLRLGQTRLAGAVIVLALWLLHRFNAFPTQDVLLTTATAGSVLLLLATLLITLKARPKPVMEPAPSSGRDRQRRGKSQASPQGKAA